MFANQCFVEQAYIAGGCNINPSPSLSYGPTFTPLLSTIIIIVDAKKMF